MSSRKKIILAKKQQLIRVITNRIYTAFQKQALKPLNVNDFKVDWKNLYKKIEEWVGKDLKEMGVEKTPHIEALYRATPEVAQVEVKVDGKLLNSNIFYKKMDWDKDIEADKNLNDYLDILILDPSDPKKLDKKLNKVVSESKIYENLEKLWEGRKDKKAYKHSLELFLKENLKKFEKPSLDEDIIFEKAKKGDISILSEPGIEKMIDGEGRTPLHYLGKKGKMEILKKSATFTAKDKDGRVPLHELAIQGVDAILKYPKVGEIQDNTGKTPLIYLAMLGKKDTLHHEAVSKVKDKNGWTGLHYLAKQNITEVLEDKAVAKVKDNKGNTPLHLLGAVGNKAILDDPHAWRVENSALDTPLHLLIKKTPIRISDLKAKRVFKKFPPEYKDGDKIDTKILDALIKTNTIGD